MAKCYAIPFIRWVVNGGFSRFVVFTRFVVPYKEEGFYYHRWVFFQTFLQSWVRKERNSFCVVGKVLSSSKGVVLLCCKSSLKELEFAWVEFAAREIKRVRATQLNCSALSSWQVCSELLLPNFLFRAEWRRHQMVLIWPSGKTHFELKMFELICTYEHYLPRHDSAYSRNSACLFSFLWLWCFTQVPCRSS